MARSTHYTAQLAICRVDKEDGQNSPGRVQVEASRVVTEVGNINIKATDFENLKTKLSGHISLLDPDDIVDPRG